MDKQRIMNKLTGEVVAEAQLPEDMHARADVRRLLSEAALASGLCSVDNLYGLVVPDVQAVEDQELRQKP